MKRVRPGGVINFPHLTKSQLHYNRIRTRAGFVALRHAHEYPAALDVQIIATDEPRVYHPLKS